MILRVLAAILLGGGAIGAFGGYCTARWLDNRRRRDDWRRDTEWLSRQPPR